jgi:hypothetical protein
MAGKGRNIAVATAKSPVIAHRFIFWEDTAPPREISSRYTAMSLTCCRDSQRRGEGVCKIFLISSLDVFWLATEFPSGGSEFVSRGLSPLTVRQFAVFG